MMSNRAEALTSLVLTHTRRSVPRVESWAAEPDAKERVPDVAALTIWLNGSEAVACADCGCGVPPIADEAFGISQRKGRLDEEIFGWLKQFGGLRRARLVGRWKLRRSRTSRWER
jgi:hypothetical protein